MLSKTLLIKILLSFLQIKQLNLKYFGLTKRISEIISLTYKNTNSKINVVRFGNVFASQICYKFICKSN